MLHGTVNLGDQPIDEITARDLVAYITGTMRAYYYACDVAGDCNWGGERSFAQDPAAKFWQAMNSADARLKQVTNSPAPDYSLYARGASANRSAMIDFVGGPIISYDPQHVQPTTIRYGDTQGNPSTMERWLDAGARKTVVSRRTAAAIGLGATVVGLAAAMLLGRK